MDTFRNLLLQIADEHARSRAIFYAEQYLGDKIDSYECLSVSHAIIHAFDKKETVEGEEYWEKILEYELSIDNWPD